MRQVLQDLRGGRTYLEEVPAPLCRPGLVLIQTTRSVISPGTERMLMEFGKANLLQKAMLQPERVREVISKIQTDGIAPTLEAIFSKLNEPLPLGYCNAGRVIECGDEELARTISVGTRVVSNSNHAEYVLAGKNLLAQIPEAVSDEQAAFAVPGAIALQGIRLMSPTLGESVCVMGLGLIGLLAVQLLRANGCRVFATDFNADRLAL
ncbi:MAG: zinc-binding alcohol dehydrogenase, partial [Candidatus Sumerlaeota bacterium]